MISLFAKIQDYYLRTNDTHDMSILALLRIEYMYYKHDSISSSMNNNKEIDTNYILADLSKIIYKFGDKIQKPK